MSGWSNSAISSRANTCSLAITSLRRSTGADGTSLASSRCSHSAVGRSLMISAISRMRSVALTARPPGELNRGSSVRPGLPEAAQKPCHSESEMVPTDVAVSGLEDQIGAPGRVGSCRFPADYGVLGHGLGPEIGDHRVEHGEPDVLALAGALTCKEGRSDRLSCKDRCRLVGNNGADHLRPASLGVRLKVREARQALDDRVVDSLPGIGPALADPADRDIDQPRVQIAQCRLAEAETLHGPRTKVLHQHVGTGDQLAHD